MQDGVLIFAIVDVAATVNSNGTHQLIYATYRGVSPDICDI